MIKCRHGSVTHPDWFNNLSACAAISFCVTDPDPGVVLLGTFEKGNQGGSIK